VVGVAEPSETWVPF